MINIMLRATGLRGLLLGIGICISAASYARSDMPSLPLSVKDGMPYIEDIKVGMHVQEVKQILTDAGYMPIIRGEIIVGYKKADATIMVSRNPNIPVTSIKYQLPGHFDLQDQERNYLQKKKYIDMFMSLFPNKSTCRLTRNINAHAFCKYQVMHLGKLKYRVALDIVNTSVQLKYTGE